MKRFLISILTVLMIISSLSVMAATGNIKDSVKEEYNNIEYYETMTKAVFAAPMVSSFWDVKPQGQPNGHWGYESIMKMTEMGYFAGKGVNENGEATFGPDDPMTRAEFMTVVARILYDEDNLKGLKQPNDAWWSVYYTALVDGGVITTDEFKPTEEMNKSMSRQEMSLVAVRCLEQRGEDIGNIYYSNVAQAIPDYNTIGTAYRDDVVKGYQLGLLCGNDDVGTFAPQEGLNRASATMVLYRIVEPSVRIQKDFSKPVTTPSSVVGQQIIHEGEQSKRVPAKEGDIFIKKDGTQVVLKKGPNGVVGEGQGVAPDIGMYGTNGGYVISSDEWENQLMLGLIDEGLYPYFVNAKGQSLNNNSYIVNATTGEGHWASDWSIIMESVRVPNYDGTTHGEISKDAYSMYRWNDTIGMWFGNWIVN